MFSGVLGGGFLPSGVRGPVEGFATGRGGRLDSGCESDVDKVVARVSSVGKAMVIFSRCSFPFSLWRWGDPTFLGNYNGYLT